MLDSIQAVFIDRDGTIGGGNEVVYPGEFELFPFALEAIKKLKHLNIKVFTFTNQPGIGKGVFFNVMVHFYNCIGDSSLCFAH
ncbi:hypothetical protein J6TS2_27650 [Heyndrickxia sporothermodurans]|nr:hypothetical protein J6TS2_27650 [Heyndrickxia sporothermodurans]